MQLPRWRFLDEAMRTDYVAPWVLSGLHLLVTAGVASLGLATVSAGLLLLAQQYSWTAAFGVLGMLLAGSLVVCCLFGLLLQALLFLARVV